MTPEEEFKVLEVELALEGRIYAGYRAEEGEEVHGPRCYYFGDMFHTNGNMIPCITDDFTDTFAVRCEKHVDGLLRGSGGWRAVRLGGK